MIYSHAMDSTIKKIEEDDLREQILLAARERFTHYGYGKTTMVELAQDCECSAANLYRYFSSKQDIAAAVCQQCMDERVDALRAIVRQQGLSAAERLRAYVLAGIEINRERDNGPKINELVAHILEQRQDLVHLRIQTQTSLVAEILSYGNETGEFEVDDVITTARSVFASLTLFEVPIFQPLYSEEEFEGIAHSTVDLLLKGLAKR